MTQEEFAGQFGFSVDTLAIGNKVRDSRKDQFAPIFLIERAPKAVQKALQAV